MNSHPSPPALMIFGTSSGAGKSLMATALCRVLLRQGEKPLPFKGQNMSNNAWVDESGGEMAYSQAVQAWAAGLKPTHLMNPILLKPKGDSTSEVIHLGKHVGNAKAETYYQDWFKPGWSAIRTAIKELKTLKEGGRLVLEGAGSPVEVNLQSRDLTNLRLAQYLQARCLLVSDIERGGVFAQIIGTLSLLRPVERKLIKGLLINRFRGRQELFDEGRRWLEVKTGIPVVGVMPWLNDLFPQEDSLDLIERKGIKKSPEIEIAVIKLPSISNFSDIDPLEAEPSIQIRWIEPGTSLGKPDAIIIPGSKQTLNDLSKLRKDGLDIQLKSFAKSGGSIFGICGGLQMLGRTLSDPMKIEGSSNDYNSIAYEGLNLLPLHTVFNKQKILKQRKVLSLWPDKSYIHGFELHHGYSQIILGNEKEIEELTDDPTLGWVSKNETFTKVSGTYLHGIFENGEWRRKWLNQIRREKGLFDLEITKSDYIEQRELIINRLADAFESHIDISHLIKE